jgi:hypothetical protein
MNRCCGVPNDISIVGSLHKNRIQTERVSLFSCIALLLDQLWLPGSASKGSLVTLVLSCTDSARDHWQALASAASPPDCVTMTPRCIGSGRQAKLIPVHSE